MRKAQTRKISDVLKDYLENNNLEYKLKVSRVANYWEELMGHIIFQKTDSIYIKNKVLYIHLNSSVLRNELMMMRSRIVKLMNEQMGGEYINEVIIR